MINYTVVILSYNKLPQIQLVVPSLVQYQVTELILCDDCSDDGTLGWAKDCKRFNKIWKKEKHDTYALNTLRNRGVELASLPYIVFLDADCRPEPTLFDAHDKVFELYPDAISVGLTNRYDEKGEELLETDNRYKFLAGDIGPIPWNECFGGNIAFPKSVWEKIGGFDEEFNGYWGFDDIDFGYRAMKCGIPLIVHRNAAVRHLRHPQNSPEHGNCNGRNYQLLIKKHGKIYG